MTDVVAALIWDNNKFMICQRPATKARALLWEFVGGKMEPGETKEKTLIRECREELAITVAPRDVFMEVDHVYPDITIHLTLFNATIAQGTPQMLEHNDIKWITTDEIEKYEFCPADTVILEKLKKIKKYNKLVRDKIPEIIEATGKTFTCEILNDENYLQKLDAKLNEELAEYQNDKNIEEMADLLEVMRSVITARGWTWEKLEQVRAAKAAERGGFEKKLLLKEVVEK